MTWRRGMAEENAKRAGGHKDEVRMQNYESFETIFPNSETK